MSSKFSFLFFLLSCLVTPAFSQSISDSEAIRVAVEAKKSGASDNEIASRLLKAGAMYTKKIFDCYIFCNYK